MVLNSHNDRTTNTDWIPSYTRVSSSLPQKLTKVAGNPVPFDTNNLVRTTVKITRN